MLSPRTNHGRVIVDEMLNGNPADAIDRAKKRRDREYQAGQTRRFINRQNEEKVSQ